MKEEVKVVENTVGDVVSTESTGTKSIVKPMLIAAGVAAVAGVIVTAWNKGKEKRKAKRIAKQIKALEADGYTVFSPDEFEQVTESDEEVTEE